MQSERPSTENEIQTLPYAGYGSDSTARPPRLLLRNAQRSLIGLAVLIALGLVFDVLLFTSILGVVPAGLAVVWMVSATRNNSIHLFAAPMLVDSRTIRKFRVLSFVAIFSCLAIGGFMLPRWTTAAASVSASSVSMAKLRGIESALFSYIQVHGEPADSLQRLFDIGMCSAKVFVEPMDPVATPPNSTFYSSYAYFPTGDYLVVGEEGNSLILVFSMQARFPNSGGLRREWQRAVIFPWGADLMTDREFQAALAKDKQARRSLGWPVYEWNEKTQSVIEISMEVEE